jgi:hypothetical protein
MMFCYALTVISIYFLPRRPWAHHWLVATPFQYTAISFAIAGISQTRVVEHTPHGFIRGMFTCFFICLMISRLYGIAVFEKSLLRGDASKHWDPSLTKLGILASEETADAVFIAADWGVATQVFCLSNGHPNFVHEIFWDYQGPDHIISITQKTEKNFFYIITLDPISHVKPETTNRILHDAERLKDWREVTPETEFAKLEAVTVRKFARSK